MEFKSDSLIKTISRKINHQSIQFRISSVVIVITLLILSIYGFYNYQVNKSELMSSITEKAAVVSERLSKTLSTPLWNLDNEETTAFITSEMADEDILGILVKEQGASGVYVGLMRTAIGSKEIIPTKTISLPFYLKKGVAITRQNVTIGSVEVFITDYYANQELRSSLINTLITILILIVSLLFSLHFAIKFNVIKPVEKIVDRLQSMSDEVLNASRQITDGSEQIAEQTNDQAASVEQSYAAMEELSSQVFENNSNAKEVTRIIHEARYDGRLT